MKLKALLLLLLTLSSSAFAADTKLTGLAQGTCADLYYGEQGSASKKYNGCLVYNVVDFGADPTGTADSTTNIQAAINALNATATTTATTLFASAVTTSGTSAGSAVLTIGGGVPASVQSSPTSFVANNTTHPASVPSFRLLSATSTTVTLASNVPGGQSVSSGDTITFGQTTVTIGGGVPAVVQANPSYYSIIDNTASGATGGGLHVISATSTTVTLADTASVLSPGIGNGDSLTFYSSVRGRVFFPAGRYKVTAPLTYSVPGGDFSIVFEGAGDLSQIFGNVSGYIFDRNTQPYAVGGGVIAFRYLKINNGTSLGGAIRFGSTTSGSVEDCTIIADLGVVAEEANADINQTAYSLTVKGNRFQAANAWVTGSNALILTNNSTSIDNDISAYDVAYRIYGTAINIINGRSEVNNTGILIGLYPDGTGRALTGFNILGGSFESNLTAIDFSGSGGYGTVSGVVISGFPGAGPSGGNPAYGIKCNDEKCNNVVFSGIRINGTLATSGFLVGNNSNRGYNVIMGVESVSWTMPTKANTAIFLNNNTPTANGEYTFANLPSSPLEGDTYDISDCNTATFLATAAGGGSGATARRRVRWNATSSVWQVIG